MIFNFILAVVSFLINGIASILPTFSVFPQGLGTSLPIFMAHVNGWNWLVPIGTLQAVFFVLVVLVLLEFTYFVATYVLSIIHASIRG